VLAIPVSAVVSETTFSIDGRILDPFRSSLSPSTVQALVCCQNWLSLAPIPINFFFGKLTYVLKEEDTNIIRGIPQIYNDNRNIKQQMATG
jgi:hypothetical protein